VRAVVFAVPGSLETPTGGYAYDRRIIDELGALGWHAEVLDLGDGFPRPGPALRAAACASLAALPLDQPVVIDGLAYGVLPEAGEALHKTHKLVALVHHPLALESGLAADEAHDLRASERAALSFAHHVVCSSPATARLLTAEFGVLQTNLTVVCPGTDRVAVDPRKDREGEPHLLAVGSIVPRKGYDLLIAALARLKHLRWRLTIVGDADRSPATARHLAAEIVRQNLAARVTLTGAVAAEKLHAFYAAADLFVLPSRFEGYGMAYAEAIAHGLPVVGTTAGAIPETVPAGAGVLVPPDDIDALAAVLRPLIEHSKAREDLAAGARAAAQNLPTWRQSAELFAQVLSELA
jgi:glycosyltransferase involved in cell wall biosynthesis